MRDRKGPSPIYTPRRLHTPRISGAGDVTHPAPAIGRRASLDHHETVLRVLVVEDDQDTAESMRSLLDLCGYLVVVARNSEEGIKAARQIEPHVVLCDIGLPDSDGYTVGSVLRQSGATASAKLIAVTGRSGPQNRLKALAAGFDEHLVKPVDPQDLLHKMQRRAH